MDVKWSLRVCILMLGAGVATGCLMWLAGPRSRAAPSSEALPATTEPTTTSPSTSRRSPVVKTAEASGDLPPSLVTQARPEWLTRLLTNGTTSTVPREKIDHWIARNGTNSESLLAAAQVGGGQEFLMQALALHPNDARVLCAAIRLDDTAEAKRERLDRFKAAAPDNALPFYLSARQHLKDSQPEQAVADLLAASQLSRFEDYTLDAMQNAEELYLAAGLSPGEAKALGGSSVLLPHLAQLKDLTIQLMDLRQNYLAAGDTESADNLVGYALQLGDQLMTGDGSRFSINQLVGAALQRIALNKLEPGQQYDFISGSVGENKDQIIVFRNAIKQDAQMAEQWLSTANEQDVINYFERIKLYGERSALEWLKRMNH